MIKQKDGVKYVAKLPADKLKSFIKMTENNIMNGYKQVMATQEYKNASTEDKLELLEKSRSATRAQLREYYIDKYGAKVKEVVKE